jgi:hypothetical protein
MSDKPAAQEPRHGEHRRANPDNDDQMDEINVIIGGSMSIASKTLGEKLEKKRDQHGSTHQAIEKNEVI